MAIMFKNLIQVF